MSNGMKILCACEESQAVTKELRRLGAEQWGGCVKSGEASNFKQN